MTWCCRARTDDSDESLAAFVKRRLGREGLERLVQPLVAGIYTADPAELSLKATLPQFLAMERQHGSVIRGGTLAGRHVPLGGAERLGGALRAVHHPGRWDGHLPRTLAAALTPGDSADQHRGPADQPARPGSPWLIELLDGPPLSASAVVLATEAHATARLVDGFDPDLAQRLRAIPYASSVIVNVGYRRDQVAHPLDGFGAVVPEIERRSILAVSFLSVKFAHRAPPARS